MEELKSSINGAENDDTKDTQVPKQPPAPEVPQPQPAAVPGQDVSVTVVK